MMSSLSQVRSADFGARVLVVAPHPDDEIIGCGAVLRDCAVNGADVRCLHLTSGEATRAGSGMTAASRGQVREQEARTAGRIIGFAEQKMLRLPDGRLRADEVATGVREFLDRFDPTAIFLPTSDDAHSDHQEAYKGTVTAAAEAQAACYGYEVWSSIARPHIYFDATRSFWTKRRALKKYRLAGEVQNYVRWTTGLNTYRSNMLGGRGFAEVFVRVAVAKTRPPTDAQSPGARA